MVDTGTFQVTLRQAKPFQILYNGEETEIKNLLGTRAWDKVNNIITIADVCAQKTGYCATRKVTSEAYDSFIKEMKGRIAESQFGWK